MSKEEKRCGFIAIIGRPNVGKSTLLNMLVGQKISITSKKSQTTQNQIIGIHSTEDTQYLFVDTPGFQTRYLNPFNHHLNKLVINSLENIDVILYIVENNVFNLGDEQVLNLLPTNANVILVVNKTDSITQNTEFTKNLLTKYPFKSGIHVSAKHSHNLNQLPILIKSFLPFSPFLYPIHHKTNRDNKFLMSEIVREKLFRSLGAELPYNLMVEIETFEELSHITQVSAKITVAKEQHKPMIIGKDGLKLKKIATDARIDMEKFLQNKVNLDVWIKVKSNFSDELKLLKNYD